MPKCIVIEMVLPSRVRLQADHIINKMIILLLGRNNLPRHPIPFWVRWQCLFFMVWNIFCLIHKFYDIYINITSPYIKFAELNINTTFILSYFFLFNTWHENSNWMWLKGKCHFCVTFHRIYGNLVIGKRFFSHETRSTSSTFGGYWTTSPWLIESRPLVLLILHSMIIWKVN